MEKVQKTTIDLIRYVLTGNVPEVDTDVDFEALYSFSKSHGTECMVFDALKSLNIEIPQEVAEKFENAYLTCVMVDTLQTEALRELSEAFENAEIDHVPLKGSVVKYLYPMPHYRKSGDIDILIKPEDEEKAEKVMSELGYKVEAGWNEHDVHATFKKEPCIEAEIHNRLVSTYERSNSLCGAVWDQASLKSECLHTYKLKDEFLFVYLLAHMCKHLYYGGAGIRLAADLFVLKQRLAFDEKKLEMLIEKAELCELNEMLAPLVSSWFECEKDLEGSSKTLESIICQSGNFGTAELREEILASDSVMGKLSRFRRQVFPTSEWLKMRYKKLSDKKYPLIFMWAYSWGFILKEKRYKIPEYLKDTFSSKSARSDMKKIVEAVRNK